MINSYSQTGQDISVSNFYKEQREKYFIEIGAYDGIYLSNSYSLEKELNWKGICIEPLPVIFELLQNNRSCICLQTAIYSKSDMFLEFINHDMLSGIAQNIDSQTYILNDNKIVIKTQTLTDIMDGYRSPSFIEYLSVDTEGSELEILKGIDWDRYTFGYISIEHNFVYPRRDDMKKFLIDRGYVHFKENQQDDDYIYGNLTDINDS